LAFSSCVIALALGVSACGSSSSSSGGGGKKVTISSSLPLQGATRPQSVDVNKGETLALKQAGGKGGSCTVTFNKLDDATAQAGQWDAGATSANARKAAQDKSAVAYLGEFNSGASAISIPITELHRRLAELHPDREVVAYCRGPYCAFADSAVRLLLENGFRARRLEDGLPEWRAAGLPVKFNVRG